MTFENFSHPNRAHLTPHDEPTFCKWIWWKDYEVPKNRNLESVSAKNEFFSHLTYLYSPTCTCVGPTRIVSPRRAGKKPTVPVDGVVADVQLPKRDEEADPVGELAQVL
jgi:hypothetical protein